MRNNSNRQKSNRQQQVSFTVQPSQNYAGYGPASWTRSDEFIEDDICKRLYSDSSVDATGLQIAVENGNLTLSGYVPTERQRLTAMALASSVTGVKHLNNHIDIAAPTGQAQGQQAQGHTQTSSASSGTGSGRTSRA